MLDKQKARPKGCHDLPDHFNAAADLIYDGWEVNYDPLAHCYGFSRDECHRLRSDLRSLRSHVR